MCVCVCVCEYDFCVQRARYMANGVSFVFGFRLIHLAINIQGRDRLIHTIWVVLHSLELSASPVSQVAIAIIIYKNHGLAVLL